MRERRRSTPYASDVWRQKTMNAKSSEVLCTKMWFVAQNGRSSYGGWRQCGLQCWFVASAGARRSSRIHHDRRLGRLVCRRRDMRARRELVGLDQHVARGTARLEHNDDGVVHDVPGGPELFDKVCLRHLDALIIDV